MPLRLLEQRAKFWYQPAQRRLRLAELTEEHSNVAERLHAHTNLQIIHGGGSALGG
jgi:hypothetical protein